MKVELRYEIIQKELDLPGLAPLECRFVVLMYKALPLYSCYGAIGLHLCNKVLDVVEPPDVLLLLLVVNVIGNE